MRIEQKTAAGWREVSAEEFRRRFYSVAMYARAISLLQQQGSLIAGAWEFRVRTEGERA